MSKINNSIILGIKNAKFRRQWFYTYEHKHTNIWKYFQICISVPLHLRRKMPLWVFLAKKILKNYCDIWNSTLKFAEMQKVMQNYPKQKTSHLGRKWLFRYVILGCNFEKLLSYLKSVSTNLPKCKVWYIIKNS